MSERVKRLLHNEIMNLKAKPRGKPSPTMTAYKIGHKDARHAAAELSAEHEDVQSALVEALEDMLDGLEDALNDLGVCGLTAHLDGEDVQKAKAALRRAYGEH